MRRHLLGLISLVLMGIGLAGYFSFVGVAGERSGGASVLFRAGLLLGVIWLAMPQLKTIPPWIIGTLLVGGIVILLQPKLLLLVGAILVIIGILQYAVRLFVPKMSVRRSTRGTPKNTR